MPVFVSIDNRNKSCYKKYNYQLVIYSYFAIVILRLFKNKYLPNINEGSLKN